MKRALNITFYLIFFYFCIYISSARPTNNDNNEQGINNRKNNLRKGSEYNGQLIGSSDNGDTNLQQDGNHINMVGNDGHGASGGDNTRESTVNLRSVQAEGVESQSGTTHHEHGSGLTTSTETAVEGCTKPDCTDCTRGDRTVCPEESCTERSTGSRTECSTEGAKCSDQKCTKCNSTTSETTSHTGHSEGSSGVSDTTVQTPVRDSQTSQNRTNSEQADVRSEDQGSKSEPDTTVTNSLQEITLTDKGNIDITNEEELVKEEIEDVDNDDTEEEEEQEQVITEDTIKEDMEEEEEDDEDEEEEEQEEEQIQQENEKETSQKNEEKESRTNDTKAHDSLAKDYREDIEIKKMADTFVSTLISLLDNSNGVNSTIKDLSKDITQFLLT
ncbi:uncharacterized protein PMUG01_10046700 [Plasmodium malariae]|uniref:S-antigen protein n=1 Tax=Plasmodium malariae TaxID=5858 RepID=A0A1D3RJ72_PLAMA|nr:uncharacterized protein PMUG01_10046700 [Plasmodium malariae]SCN45230.1 hypothetical protein PMUG01_10046700 [Plasmodium malariae]